MLIVHVDKRDEDMLYASSGQATRHSLLYKDNKRGEWACCAYPSGKLNFCLAIPCYINRGAGGGWLKMTGALQLVS